MLYIRPSASGYTAFDLYHHAVFTEDGCEKLFSFLESAPSDLTDLLQRYFDECIDADTMAMIQNAPNTALCEEIKKRMEQIHPYLSSNRYLTVFGMLAEHLNTCVWDYASSSAAIPPEEYEQLYRHLIMPMIQIGSEPLPPSVTPTSREFISKYMNQLDAGYKDVSARAVSGLRYIETVRAEAERYVFWVLDQSSIRFRDLDRDMRVRLYSRLFRTKELGSDLRFISYYYWKEPEEYDYYAHTTQGRLMHKILNEPHKSFDEAILENRAIQRRAELIDYLRLLRNDKQQITEELKEFVDDELYAAQHDTTPTLFEEFRVDNFYQLIQLQLWLLTKDTVIIKKCRHCGRLFLAERQTIDYCSRIMEGETEPCDIAGPKKAYSKLMDEDPLLKTYNRVYKTVYARMKRGSISEEDYVAWKTEARSRLDKARAGEIPEDEFLFWLRKDIRSWGSADRVVTADVKPEPRLGE